MYTYGSATARYLLPIIVLHFICQVSFRFLSLHAIAFQTSCHGRGVSPRRCLLVLPTSLANEIFTDRQSFRIHFPYQTNIAATPLFFTPFINIHNFKYNEWPAWTEFLQQQTSTENLNRDNLAMFQAVNH
jgi:hypothetical protein